MTNLLVTSAVRVRSIVYTHTWQLALVLATFTLAAGVLLLWPREPGPATAVQTLSAQEVDSAQQRFVIVYVSGAVRNPGLYRREARLRVGAAIVAAVAVLAAWSAGIMAGVLLSPLAPWLLLGAVAAVIAGLALKPSPIFAAILLAGFLCGAGRAALAATPTLPSEIAGRPVTLAGTVDDDPVARPGGTRLVVAVEGATLADGSRFRHLRIQTTIYGRQPPHYGDRLILTGRLEEPARFEQFDYRTYLSDQGISGVLQSARLVRVVAGAGDPFHTVLFGLRHAVVGTVDRILPEPQAALLLGVVFGYRAALPPALQQQMINSGLIHIVVISGLKVSLLARIIQRAAGRILPRAAPGIALGAMVVYALLAGASAAALRAAAMGGLVVLAGAVRRDTHVFASMALTGAVMLGLKPALAHD